MTRVDTESREDSEIVGRGKRAVDHRAQSVALGNGHHLLQIGYVQKGIGRRFREQQDEYFDILDGSNRLAAISPGGTTVTSIPKALQHAAAKLAGAPVAIRRDNHVLTRPQEW